MTSGLQDTLISQSQRLRRSENEPKANQGETKHNPEPQERHFPSKCADSLPITPEPSLAFFPQFNEISCTFSTPQDVESTQVCQVHFLRRLDKCAKYRRPGTSNSIWVGAVFEDVLLRFAKELGVIIVVSLEELGTIHVSPPIDKVTKDNLSSYAITAS